MLENMFLLEGGNCEKQTGNGKHGDQKGNDLVREVAEILCLNIIKFYNNFEEMKLVWSWLQNQYTRKEKGKKTEYMKLQS